MDKANQLLLTATPTGLVFVSEEGGAAPASQEVRIFNRSQTRDLQVTVTPAAWVEPAMTSFTLKSFSEAAIRFDVKPSVSAPGVYRDVVRVLAAGQTLEVQVAWMIVPRGSPVPLSRSSAAPVAALTGPDADFDCPTRDPVHLLAAGLDGCGQEQGVIVDVATIRPVGEGNPLPGGQGISIHAAGLGTVAPLNEADSWSGRELAP